MAAKKAVCLSKLTFNELKDKAKTLEGFKKLNRFELLQALRQADNKPAIPAAEAEKMNPRGIKPEIKAAKAKLAETPKDDKNARKALRQAISRLKQASREYLRQ